MTGLILQAKDLTAGYDRRAVVRDITFAVRPSEIVTLVGPNGAGKSTILKLITKQIKSISGEVQLCGNLIDKIDPNEIAQIMSILTTDRVRAEKLTVRDVVSLGR